MEKPNRNVDNEKSENDFSFIKLLNPEEYKWFPEMEKGIKLIKPAFLLKKNRE